MYSFTLPESFNDQFAGDLKEAIHERYRDAWEVLTEFDDSEGMLFLCGNPSMYNLPSIIPYRPTEEVLHPEVAKHVVIEYYTDEAHAILREHYDEMFDESTSDERRDELEETAIIATYSADGC